MYGTRQTRRGVVNGELQRPARDGLVCIPEMKRQVSEAFSEFVWISWPCVTEIEKLVQEPPRQ